MTIEEQCRDTTGYRFGVCLEWSHVRTPAFLASFLVLLGAAVEYGTWYARSAEFLQTSTMDTLRWLRMVGDSIFAVGIRALG
jgi:nitric oxide reductase large subunit